MKILSVSLFLMTSLAADAATFTESFETKLQPGWSWVREHKEFWRLREGALEIRLEPGNMWGPENSGRNVLVRELPDDSSPTEITVTVWNKPTEQYEQVDLVWYYTDSNMIKIGQELVDGQLSIVMGREEGDRARTIAIIPISAEKIQLRFVGSGRNVTGYFRENAEGPWRKAGECDKPVLGRAKVAIQCYQGPKNVERWARIDDLTIAPVDKTGN